MTPTPAQVSVAELLASGVRPYPDEAIAIVQQVCRHRLRGSPGVLKASLPTPETLTIDASGTVSFFGTVLAEGGAAVVHLARMLHSMLPEPGTAAALYVPSALTVTLVRGLSEMVLPTFGSVEAFSHRLEPFEPVDGAQALRGLFERWRQAHPVASQMAAAGPEPLVDLQLHPQELPAKAAPPRERPKEPWSGLDRRMPQLEEVESDIPVPPHLVLQAPSRDDDRSLRSSRYGERAALSLVRADSADDNSALVLREEAPLVLAAEDEPAPVAIVGLGLNAWQVPAERRASAGRDGRMRRGALLAASAAALVVAAAWMHTLSPAAPENGGRGPDAAPAGVSTAGVSSESGAPAAVTHTDRKVEDVSAAPAGTTSSAARPERLSRADRIAPTRRPRLATASPVPAAHASMTAGPTMNSGPPANESIEATDAASFTGAAVMTSGTMPIGNSLEIVRVADGNASVRGTEVSPDGRWIAFDSDRAGQRAVYLAARSGQGVRRVSAPGAAYSPRWAPDGARFAFVQTDTERPGVSNLWVADVRSGQTTRVTTNADGRISPPSWFPDGRRVAYAHGRELVVQNVANGERAVFAAPGGVTAIASPSVSPDGRRVIFSVPARGAWLLDVKDGSVRRVLTDPDAQNFTWSPDGKRVAFRGKDGEWSMWMVGSAAR